jgi:hypothetical protein
MHTLLEVLLVPLHAILVALASIIDILGLRRYHRRADHPDSEPVPPGRLLKVELNIARKVVTDMSNMTWDMKTLANLTNTAGNPTEMVGGTAGHPAVMAGSIGNTVRNPTVLMRSIVNTKITIARMTARKIAHIAKRFVGRHISISIR